jgi:HK97 family phage prohead protease
MTLLLLRSAIAVHHTPTTDATWDVNENVSRCPSDADHLGELFAWRDTKGDPDLKGSYKFAHHMVDADGNVGDANAGACSTSIGYLNRDPGSSGYPDIPAADRQGVWNHVAAHLRDANKDDPKYEPPGLRGLSGGFEERAAFTGARLELRAGRDASTMPRIVGHAAVYSQWSQDLGGFKERVMPGAFTKALDGGDIRALFNHDANFILGRQSSGTLELTDEKKGLHFEASPPDTQTIRDLVIAPMTPRNGSDVADLNQCSFAFLPVQDEWRAPKLYDGLYERDLVEVQLFDVSAVTFPAYDQTDVGLRSRLAGQLGLDLPGLTSFFARAFRSVALDERDLTLVRDTVAILRSYLPPEANGGEPSGANAGEASRTGQPAGGASRARLLREFEHRLRIDGLAVAGLTTGDHAS